MNNNDIIKEQEAFIKKQAAFVKVETPFGSAVKVTKKEALRLLKTIKAHNRKPPKFDCVEIMPFSYLVIISTGEPGLFIEN